MRRQFSNNGTIFNSIDVYLSFILRGLPLFSKFYLINVFNFD